MKAALGFCYSVGQRRDGDVEIRIVLPASLEQTRALFRGRRVLLTLAGSQMDGVPDGVKAGAYRPDIPTLTDAIEEIDL